MSFNINHTHFINCFSGVMQSLTFLSLPKCLIFTLLLLKPDSIFISKVSTMLTSTTYSCASINPLLLLFICNVNAFGLRMKWTSSVIHRGRRRAKIFQFYKGEPLSAGRRKPLLACRCEPLLAGRCEPLSAKNFKFYKGEPLLACRCEPLLAGRCEPLSAKIFQFYKSEPLLAGLRKPLLAGRREPLSAKIFQFYKSEPLSAGRSKPLSAKNFQFYKGEPLLAKVSTQNCKFYASWCQRKSFFFKYLNAAPVTDLV